jgi:hypothetical protein
MVIFLFPPPFFYPYIIPNGRIVGRIVDPSQLGAVEAYVWFQLNSHI